MTCAELKEQLGALAAGALEPAEREACERHLASNIPHEGCAEALRLANEAAALMGAALPPLEPGPDVWRAIEGRLAPPRAAAPPGRGRWAQRSLWLSFAAAAAVIAATATTLLGGSERRRLQDAHAREVSQLEGQVKSLSGNSRRCEEDLGVAKRDLGTEREALAMLQLPETSVIPLAAQAGAEKLRASALYNPKQQHAMVVLSGLKPPAGKDYELWVIRGKDKIAAGVLHGDASGALVMHVGSDLLASGAPDAFAVTLEPAGGGTAPRGPIMLVGALPKG